MADPNLDSSLATAEVATEGALTLEVAVAEFGAFLAEHKIVVKFGDTCDSIPPPFILDKWCGNPDPVKMGVITGKAAELLLRCPPEQAVLARPMMDAAFSDALWDESTVFRNPPDGSIHNSWLLQYANALTDALLRQAPRNAQAQPPHAPTSLTQEAALAEFEGFQAALAVTLI